MTVGEHGDDQVPLILWQQDHGWKGFHNRQSRRGFLCVWGVSFFLWTSDSVVFWPRNSHHPIYTTSHTAPSYMRPHSTQQYEIKYAFSSVSFLSSHLMSMTRIELRQVSFHTKLLIHFYHNFIIKWYKNQLLQWTWFGLFLQAANPGQKTYVISIQLWGLNMLGRFTPVNVDRVRACVMGLSTEWPLSKYRLKG